MRNTFKLLIAALILNFSLTTLNCALAQDAEYQLIRRTYTVNNDGTIDIRFRKEIKLLRNRAITAYADKGETFILYNPAIDQLTINESYTIRPDGSRVQTPANAFVDQLPSECQDCGRYNGIRERAVIHTALEYNCIIVLDYTIHRKTSYLDEQIILAEDCPIKKYQVVFKVNAKNQDDLPFGFEPSNMPKTYNLLKNGNYWQLSLVDIPQTYKDRYLPMPKDLYPSVHLFYGNDNNKVNNDEALPEANHVITELSDSDPVVLATNIRNYVVDHIKVNDIPASLLAYRTSSARETFLSACGTPADKNILLAAMLRQAGFKAYTDQRHVFVTIKEKMSEVDYRISAAMKSPLRPDGAAIDEQRTIEVDENIVWRGERLGGGYNQMKLPTVAGSISINPARLTSDRKAPLLVRNCNEKYRYSIALPRTPPRRLVGKPVDISYTKKDVGSIRISISQEHPGAAIVVVRELSIDVPDGIVTPQQYPAFRQLIQDWNAYNTITIR